MSYKNLSSSQQNEILEGLRNGKSSAVDALHAIYYANLCKVTDYLIADLPAAEDLVTDAFVALWGKRKEFKNFNHIHFFLFRTTKNASLNFLRRKMSFIKISRELAWLSSGYQNNFGLTEIIKRESKSELLSAMKYIPDKSREVFQMMVFAGRSTKEIATRLGITISTVKNHKQRAVRILRTKLNAGYMPY